MERGRERDPLSTSSFYKWPLQSDLTQKLEARKSILTSHLNGRGPKQWGSLVLPSQVHQQEGR